MEEEMEAEAIPGYVKEDTFWGWISPKIRDELRIQKSVLLRPVVLAGLLSVLVYWRTEDLATTWASLIGLAWVLSIS